MRIRVLLTVLMLLVAAANTSSQELIPIDVHVETVGRGEQGTVVAVTVWIQPEDRALVGDRLEVRSTLSSSGVVVEDLNTVVPVGEKGDATVTREWPPGSYFLSVMVSSTARPAVGFSDGEVEVPEAEGVTIAVTEVPSLDVLTPPDEDAFHFLPLPDINSLEAFHVGVAVPRGTALVEFFHDSKLISRRRRPPWSIRISTREIVQRGRFRAVALDNFGRYLGEDVIIINAPAGESGIEILVAPESAASEGGLPVTIALTDQREILQVSLFLDDELVARWERCPCVTEIPLADLENAAVLSAEVVDSKGNRSVEVGNAKGGFWGSVDVDLVELQVQVFDSHNVPVPGLDPGDFSVFEDGREIKIDGGGAVADQPLSLLLAVDTSGSMTERFPEVRLVVEDFAEDLLEPGDQAALLRFSSDIEILVPWSDDPEDIGRGLGEVDPGGSTSLHDAIIHSLMELHNLRGRKALVVLTDGADTNSFASWADANWFSQSMRVPLFVITLSSGDATRTARSRDIPQVKRRHRIATLARNSGGRAFFRVTINQLPEVYEKIAGILRSQYVLWYRPQATDTKGEFRSIKVTVDEPGIKVRTISGYYSGR